MWVPHSTLLATTQTDQRVLLWDAADPRRPKLVRTLDEAMRRIQEYSFPLEDARLREAYGMGSGIGKILIVNRDPVPGRLTLILVKQNLGF